MSALKARVQAGRLVLDEPTDLPDGREVELLPVAETVPRPSDSAPRRLSPPARPRMQTQQRGTLVDLFAEPLGFKLKTASGLIDIHADEALRETIRSLWDRDVLVTIDTAVDSNGHFIAPHALGVEPLIQSTDLLADYLETRGQGRDLWASDEAQAYLQALRGRDEAP